MDQSWMDAHRAAVQGYPLAARRAAPCRDAHAAAVRSCRRAIFQQDNTGEPSLPNPWKRSWISLPSSFTSRGATTEGRMPNQRFAPTPAERTAHRIAGIKAAACGNTVGGFFLHRLTRLRGGRPYGRFGLRFRRARRNYTINGDRRGRRIRD